MTQSGRFVWAELFTTKKEAALEFYGELLGWSIKEMPMGDFNYTMFSAGDTGVGGVGGADVNESQWLLYLTVDDVDAKTKQALSAGAQPYMPPTDIPNTGRFAIIADAGGAALAIFDGGGGPAGAEKGAIAWNELLARDVDGAVSFYGALFGWTAQTMPMAHGPYTVLMQGGTPVGGIMSLETLNLPSVPPHWMHYLLVDDVDAALAKAESMGGKVCTPGTSIPGVGRFAIFNDPVGTHTAIFSK